MLPLEPFSEDRGRSTVHPTRGVPANQLPCASRVCTPVDSHACQTPWSVFQDGSDGEPADRCRKHAGARSWHARRARAATPIAPTTSPRVGSTTRALVAVTTRNGPHPEPSGGPAQHRSASDRGTPPAPIRFPPDNFKHSLTLFSKSFSSFPRGTCSLSVSRPYLASALFGLHSQTTRLAECASRCDRVRARRGSHPLRCPVPGDLGPVRH
ncbi:hypothetical protein QJS04_geneDACA011495 [Acorus gramineus]|uniref:Protein TAR1 n=1 Tax=Acorus gramineus TaxID=55184 RepID=A0AAV9A2T9_ACOGR|nr:hypothetical protein QJS04_geneDACA011495 [Acorus gramineus]